MENKTMTAGKNAFRKEVRADGTYEVLDGGNYLPSVEIKEHQHSIVLERGFEFDEEGHLSGEWAEEVCAECGYKEMSGCDF